MGNYVKYEIQNKIAIITIDRPKAYNALNNDVLLQIGLALDLIEQEENVNVFILTGAGDKSFVAGADIVAMQKMTPMQAKEFSIFGQSVMNRIAKMNAIVIAAINGYALGGGCELAMACDLRIAATNAKLGIPEVTLGVIPGFGGTQRLSRLVGIGRAMELLATGGQIDAEEAYRIGLVNRVVKQEELMDYCLALAEKIAANSANAIALGKQCIYAGEDMDLDSGLAYEAGQFALTFSTPDQSEGMTAFVEKRKPHFN